NRQHVLIVYRRSRVGRLPVIGDRLLEFAPPVVDISDVVQPARQVVVFQLAGKRNGGGEGIESAIKIAQSVIAQAKVAERAFSHSVRPCATRYGFSLIEPCDGLIEA